MACRLVVVYECKSVQNTRDQDQELYISYSYTEGRLARLHIISPETLAWRLGRAVPRNNHCMAALNGILTVVGGYGGREAPGDLATIGEYHEDVQE